MLTGVEGSPVIVPGQSQESRLVQVLHYDEFDTQMPPAGKLPPEEIALLTKWIDAGAVWPESPQHAARHEKTVCRRPRTARSTSQRPLRSTGPIVRSSSPFRLPSLNFARGTDTDRSLPRGAAGSRPV